MQCTLEELRQKEVIDMRTGERLGYIDDIDMDMDSRVIRGFRIYGRRFLGGFFRREPDLFIPCDAVKLYGMDVLLTEYAETVGQCAQKKRLSTSKDC